MIPMSCPSCGRRGNVPLDRLNTRMHCKKCDAVFHLDATGKPMLGEPPPPKGSKAARGREKNEPLDPIGIVAGKIAKAPTIIWKVLGGALVLVALFYVFKSFRPKPITAEQEFGSRNQQAAIAFLEKDVSTLQGMSADNTREEIAQVVEKFRPLVGDAAGTGSEGMMPMAQIPETLADNVATSVSIMPPAPGPGLDAPPTFQLYLVWMKAKDRYYLDGKETLKLNEKFLEYDKKRKEVEKEKAKGRRY